jgi:hypothetical protein
MRNAYGQTAISPDMQFARMVMGNQRPVNHWAQGLSNLANAYVGKQMMDQAQEKQVAQQRDASGAFFDAIAGKAEVPGDDPTLNGVSRAQFVQMDPRNQAFLAQLEQGKHRQSQDKPIAVMDERGLPIYVSGKDAIGRRPYEKRANPPPRKTVTARDGRVYYADTGKLVVPHAPKPKNRYDDMLEAAGIEKGTLEAAQFISSKGAANVKTTVSNTVPLERSTKSTLEKEVMGDEQTLERLSFIEELYDPRYLTYAGAGKAAISDFMNKLDPGERSEFAQKRAAFISQQGQYFNAYRKWATGAAASEREMADIKRSIPSENDSPQSFESKMAALKSISRRLLVRKKRWLASGLDIPLKDFAKQNPLDSIPTLQQRGEELWVTFKGDAEQVRATLAQEGYF